MNCINCGKPMEIGRLESGRNYFIYWIPQDGVFARWDKPLRTTERALQEEGAQLISPVKRPGWFVKKKPAAWLCRNCSYVVVKCISVEQ